MARIYNGETRYESLLRLSKLDTDECVIWPYFKNKGAGGRATIGTVYCGRYILECRFGRKMGRWEYACHTCDNPSCVNERHIFLGSPKDNAQDKVAKGRHRHGVFHGEDHPQSKLTEDDVLAIRASKKTQRELAHQYKCSQSNISLIKNGRHWKTGLS